MARATFAAMKRSERRQEAKREQRASTSHDNQSDDNQINVVRQRKVHSKTDSNASDTASTGEMSPNFKLFTPKDSDPCWAPNISTVFKLLTSVRISAAIWAPISDCDEVFNYWEPLHLWLYGNGMQTWEYSPVYAIRSYLYILLHYLPALPFQLLLPHTKITTFFFIRCFLTFTHTLAEIYLYKAIRDRLGAGVARYYLTAIVFAAGMFISTPAFLPSSFAMCMNAIVIGAVLNENVPLGVFATAIATLIGWPFAGVIGLPVILYSLNKARQNRKALFDFGIYALVLGSIISGALVAYDSHYYGRKVLAPLNIVLYNVFSPHGPNLYGTAPLSFYLYNLVLNWNLVSTLALVTLPTMFVALVFAEQERVYRDNDEKKNAESIASFSNAAPVIFFQLTLLLWLTIFFLQAHKEERFLFPIYPLLALSAAVTLYSIERLLQKITGSINIAIGLPSTILIVFVLLSSSRIVAQYKNYHAPFDIYIALNERLVERSRDGTLLEEMQVCVGKEWYRYPSSFFIPSSDMLRLSAADSPTKSQHNTTVAFRFVRSEFRGLLPSYFDSKLPFPEITRKIPENQNDANKEVLDRYVDPDECDYMIDLQMPKVTEFEPDYASNTIDWSIVKTEPFLLSEYTGRFYRAFFIPYKNNVYTHWANYVLLERQHLHPRGAH